MGWSSGRSIAEPLIKVIRDNVERPQIRQVIYEVLIRALVNHDWDTTNEVRGIDPIFDDLLDHEFNWLSD